MVGSWQMRCTRSALLRNCHQSCPNASRLRAKYGFSLARSCAPREFYTDYKCLNMRDQMVVLFLENTSEDWKLASLTSCASRITPCVELVKIYFMKESHADITALFSCQLERILVIDFPFAELVLIMFGCSWLTRRTSINYQEA